MSCLSFEIFLSFSALILFMTFLHFFCLTSAVQCITRVLGPTDRFLLAINLFPPRLLPLVMATSHIYQPKYLHIPLNTYSRVSGSKWPNFSDIFVLENRLFTLGQPYSPADLWSSSTCDHHYIFFFNSYHLSGEVGG